MGPFEGSGHYMALITFIIGNTMDWNRFKEFGHLKCIICVNIVNFAVFHGFQPYIQPKLDLLKALVTKNDLIWP